MLRLLHAADLGAINIRAALFSVPGNCVVPEGERTDLMEVTASRRLSLPSAPFSAGLADLVSVPLSFLLFSSST